MNALAVASSWSVALLAIRPTSLDRFVSSGFGGGIVVVVVLVDVDVVVDEVAVVGNGAM